jgi:hypothetical protein
MTQPTGTGTFFVFYTGAGGQRRKLRLGEHHPEHFTLREARAKALEALAAISGQRHGYSSSSEALFGT